MLVLMVIFVKCLNFPLVSAHVVNPTWHLYKGCLRFRERRNQN